MVLRIFLGTPNVCHPNILDNTAEQANVLRRLYRTWEEEVLYPVLGGEERSKCVA